MTILESLKQWGHWFSSGWHVFLSFYVLTTVSYVVGLIARRARWDRFVTAPIAGAPLAFSV